MNEHQRKMARKSKSTSGYRMADGGKVPLLERVSDTVGGAVARGAAALGSQTAREAVARRTAAEEKGRDEIEAVRRAKDAATRTEKQLKSSEL